MKSVSLFVLSTIVTGACAVIGSMIGHFAGSHSGVMLGGFFGGMAGVALSARIAAGREWIARDNLFLTTLGGEIGCLLRLLSR
jgi:hypothetical protein